MTFTLVERRERGETFIDRHGIEMVHGRALAREALAGYDATVAEADRVYRTVSPFRSDYAEINDSIDAEMLGHTAELAYGIQQWIQDDEWVKTRRDHDIAWEAERSEEL